MQRPQTSLETSKNAEILLKNVNFVNNVPSNQNEECYQFFVFDHPHHVGLIRPRFMVKEVNWPAQAFKVDHGKRTVTLTPGISTMGYEAACKKAMVDFCEQNQDLFPKAFKPWLKLPEENRDYHGIIGLEGPLRGLCAATPARGIFGLATAGVHINIYEAEVDKNGNEVVTKLWLSRRSASQTFPNSLDQVAAGAIDAEDGMNRQTALKRELEEETTFKLAADGKTVTQNGTVCGKLKPQEHVVSIATRKGSIAGVKEDGHLEFAIRFAYDLRIFKGIEPVPREVPAFHSVRVADLATDGFKTDWKYSSGAVFLDFVLRHNLMPVDEAVRQEMFSKLHRDVPFKNAQKYLK